MIEIGSQVSHYRIEEKLGGGGMGVVYRANDLKLNRTIALKFLPPEITHDEDSKQRFIQEAQAASGMQHSNICTIHDIDQTNDGQMFICMDYYDGETLKKKIHRGNIPIGDTIDIAVQICEGLERAHDSGLVHRDIKPANIMVTSFNEVKIVDFGLVKLVNETSITKTNAALGTIAYMSPEQANGETVSNQTDIWALGVLLYEMLTGNRPFTGDYEQGLVYQIVNTFPPAMRKIHPDIPVKLEWIVNKCMQKRLTDRYQNVTEVKIELLQIQQDLFPEKKSISPVNKPRWIEPIWKPGLILGGILILILYLFWPFSISVPEEKYLVVVPFNNIGNSEGGQVYCDALTEIVTNKLSGLEKFHGSLCVVPSTDVRKYDVSSTRDAREMFNAGLAITGSLHKVSDNLRLLLNLVDTETLKQIRSADLNYQTASLDLLEDRMLITLADMLEIELHVDSEEFSPAMSQHRSDAYDFYFQGLGYLQRHESLENVESAISLFEQAIGIDSILVEAYAGLGEAYWRKFEADKNVKWVEYATEFCQRALSLDGNKLEVCITLGLIYNGTGKFKSALNKFNQALEIDSMSAVALRGSATAYEGLKDLPFAEKTYKKAIHLRPSYWLSYNKLGVFYHKQGRYDEAIIQFKKVIELIPQNPKGFTNLGSMYFFLNRWEDAIKIYEQSLKIKPSYIAYSNLGTLYFYKNEYENAATALENALEFDQQDYRTWGNVASCYHQITGREKDAERCYYKAIDLAEKQLEVNPNDPYILIDLCAFNNETDNTDSALMYLRRAVDSKSNDPDIMYRIAEAYERQGQRKNALEWLAKAVRNGFSLSIVNNNPVLSELREDSQFQKLLNNYNTQD